jgi:outer membrane protein TolC
MKSIVHWTLIALTLGLAGLAQAEVKGVTLEECVTTALKQNPEIRIAEKEVSKARAGIGEAYAALLPRITGSVNFQHAWNIQESVMPNFIKSAMQLPDGSYVLPGVEQMPDFLKIAFGIENTFTYGATLTQPLFLGGAGISGVKMSYAARRAAEQSLESKRQNLIFNTVNAFYGCLLAKEVIAVQEQAMDQAKGNLDLVVKKFDAGSASGFDKMRAEVDVANLQPQVISARNGYQSAVTGLKMVMGLPGDSNIDILGQMEYVEDPMDTLSLDQLRGMAARTRPEFQILKAQKSIASGGVAIARSQFLPKLFFQTDYSKLAMRNDYDFGQRDFSKGVTSVLSLQIPIFSGLGNIHAYQKARLDDKIVTDSEKQLKDGISAEAEMTFNKFQEAKQKYASAKESIAMAQEALRLATLMYDEGASTQLDVMGARLALTQSKLNFVSSLYEYQMARYQLRKAAGILNGVL